MFRGVFAILRICFGFIRVICGFMNNFGLNVNNSLNHESSERIRKKNQKNSEYIRENISSK